MALYQPSSCCSLLLSQLSPPQLPCLGQSVAPCSSLHSALGLSHSFPCLSLTKAAAPTAHPAFCLSNPCVLLGDLPCAHSPAPGSAPAPYLSTWGSWHLWALPFCKSLGLSCVCRLFFPPLTPMSCMLARPFLPSGAALLAYFCT